MAIDKTIKIPRGNSFILEVPIVERLYTGGKPVDGPVSPDEFSDWSVTVERFDTRERVAYRNFTVSAVTSVRITFDETLTVGYYNVIIGAKRGGGDVSLRMRKCFEIVEWNSLSNFEDYVAGSPVLIPAQPLLPLPQNLPLKPGTGKNSLMQSGAKEASGDDSVAFGRETEAMGPASVAEGYKTITKNKAEHAEGTFNLSIPDKTVHTVGIGLGDDSRMNAEEIHTDGKQYIIGIGGYDGTNSTTEGTKSVQDVISGLSNKQDKLVAGRGIHIDGNTIDCTLDTGIFKVVDTLPDAPATGDENKIHLVPSATTETGNIYTEYIFANAKWEKLGEFKPDVDLSNYVNLSESQRIGGQKMFSDAPVLLDGIAFAKNNAAALRMIDESANILRFKNLNTPSQPDVRLRGVATPEQSDDATNKAYVDALIQRLETAERKITELQNKLNEITVTDNTTEE